MDFLTVGFLPFWETPINVYPRNAFIKTLFIGPVNVEPESEVEDERVSSF